MPPNPTRHARAEDAVGTDQLTQLLHRLGQAGLDTDRLASEVGLEQSRLSSTEARIERRYFRELFDVAEEHSGDSLIGLHAGGMPGRPTLLTDLTLTTSQSTVGEALHEQARFAQLTFDSLRLEIVERAPYTHNQLDLGAGQTHHEIEYLTALWIRPLAARTEPRAHASEVRFAHPPYGPAPEYERLLDCSVRFREPLWAISFSNEVMNLPIAGANPAVAGALQGEAAQRLAATSSPRLPVRIAAILRSEASYSDRTLARTAKILDSSVRTLQRHLRDEGTSFQAIRDEVRREEAISLLADSRLRISEVAQRLGFRDVADFDDAFQRWTGQTPRSERRRLLADGSRASEL